MHCEKCWEEECICEKSGVTPVALHDLVLHLVLTEHWYDEIAAGRKRCEYRAMSKHWQRLIWERREKITHVRFQRGFKKNPPKMVFEVRLIDAGPCPYEGWDDFYYRIHLMPNEPSEPTRY